MARTSRTSRKDKKPTHREDLIQQVTKMIELALVYADDGAWATAAKYLREAAMEFDMERERIDALLCGCMVRED